MLEVLACVEMPPSGTAVLLKKAAFNFPRTIVVTVVWYSRSGTTGQGTPLKLMLDCSKGAASMTAAYGPKLLPSCKYHLALSYSRSAAQIGEHSIGNSAHVLRSLHNGL